MSEFFEGLADVLEVSPTEVSSSLELTKLNWDSLAVVSTIALCDDLFGVMLNGQELMKCQTVADIERMVEEAKKAG